ncbi:hypothetical protein ACFLVX_00475 [Chloroflexota bacterium]
MTFVQNKLLAAPALAAIVVVPDTYETVQRTMSYLKMQTAAKQIEVILVVPSRQQLQLDESDLSCFHSWHVVEVGEITSIAQGSVAGIRHAHTPVIALTEDHAFPDSRWAELFIAAHMQRWAAVGPCMHNGNPDNLVSWGDFYQAYGEWTHPILSGPVRHLPGHNSSYKRDILLAYGDRLEDLMQAESVLHRHLRAEGHELLLESGTCTTHLHFTIWSRWIPEQYYAGRMFAATWALTWSFPRRLLFTIASPLIPLLRLWRVQKRVRRTQHPGFLLRLLPVLFVGLVMHGIGQMVGYLVGYGDSVKKAATYEFHRV